MCGRRQVSTSTSTALTGSVPMAAVTKARRAPIWSARTLQRAPASADAPARRRTRVPGTEGLAMQQE